MKSIPRSFTLALTLLAATVLLAQDAKPVDHGTDIPKQTHKGHGDAPATGMLTRNAAEMKHLLQMTEGTWSMTIHMEPSEWSPKPANSKGKSVFKAGPNRLSSIHDFVSNGDLGPFRGHGVLWFDANAGAYKGIWCDTMSPTGCGDAGLGKWDNDKLVVQNTEEANGKTMHMTTTWTFHENAFTQEFTGGPDGEPAKKMMTIEYKRIGKAPVPPKRPTGKE